MLLWGIHWRPSVKGQECRQPTSHICVSSLRPELYAARVCEMINRIERGRKRRSEDSNGACSGRVRSDLGRFCVTPYAASKCGPSLFLRALRAAQPKQDADNIYLRRFLTWPCLRAWVCTPRRRSCRDHQHNMTINLDKFMAMHASTICLLYTSPSPRDS